MTGALRLLHYLQTRRGAWDRALVIELARTALRERDDLRSRVHELERRVKDVPKFQGMTELA